MNNAGPTLPTDSVIADAELVFQGGLPEHDGKGCRQMGRELRHCGLLCGATDTRAGLAW